MNVDTEKYRFRSYLEAMAGLGEIDIVEEPTPLSAIADRLEGNPQGVWFRSAGPERQELAGNIMGSRRRLALSLGVEERDLLAETTKRLRKPIDPIEVEGANAPVQQIVQRENKADLTALPVHLQHGEDGAPYISATLDFSRDPNTGYTNVGMRRLMLRGRQQAGIDLNAPSDLRAIYGGAHGGGSRLPVAFAAGTHPADAIAALAMTPPMDELSLMGAIRGEPVPVVKCITSDLRVPADAEYIIEGYLDADGWTEPEGPYGEYVGYYGRLKQNPVFHLTAITHRKDAVFQTATIGGRNMATTDTAQLCALRTEQAIWTALASAVREPVAVY
jgi:2,5-furandicarboxylate decarboxylase 1